MQDKDGDFEWLLSHLPPKGTPIIHQARVAKVGALITGKITQGPLPYTIGLFGNWGAGKTTFLALLADHLQNLKETKDRCSIVYFNAWKYAGFMEIVPALIYKILSHGIPDTTEKTSETIARIMMNLGQEYSDKVGKWISERCGVDPVEIFKDLYHVKEVMAEGATKVSPKLVERYYTQVDQAQDMMQKVFSPAVKAGQSTVVLIDELDRCDPDEAFNVIKQLRVFFAMREVPVLFVLCANPEPIGLAIKHRYGLQSLSSDYEARRILEKFVDAYIDMSEPLMLGDYVRSLWKSVDRAPSKYAWILATDDSHGPADYVRDTLKNVTAWQVISSASPWYGNLRLLRKSLEYVSQREFANSHLLWTAWHLEIISQIDSSFRRDISRVAYQLQETARRTLDYLSGMHYLVVGKGPASPHVSFVVNNNQYGTLFGAFRSLFWESIREVIDNVQRSGDDPRNEDCVRILNGFLLNTQRMDFLILMALLPLDDMPPLAFSEVGNQGTLAALSTSEKNPSRLREFGWLLANY